MIAVQTAVTYGYNCDDGFKTLPSDPCRDSHIVFSYYSIYVGMWLTIYSGLTHSIFILYSYVVGYLCMLACALFLISYSLSVAVHMIKFIIIIVRACVWIFIYIFLLPSRLLSINVRTGYIVSRILLLVAFWIYLRRWRHEYIENSLCPHNDYWPKT